MLTELYKQLVSNKSDISEHLPTLKFLAEKCSSVTELGVRTAVSSVAILSGCDRVTSYDLYSTPEVETLKDISPNWKFNIGDSTIVDIEETDMLFIDTLHNGSLLSVELQRHAPKVKKFIAMHDTTTFGSKGETEDMGLLPAIDYFLQNNPEWKILKVFDNNNGLTVLRRISPTVVTVYTAIMGGYDTLKLQSEQTINCRFVCFTDTDDLAIERGAEKQWEIIKVEKKDDVHSRMHAKYYRTHPYEFFDGVVMYMDGTARLKRWDSVEYFTEDLMLDNDLVLFEHPERKTILEEAIFYENNTDRFKKYRGLPLIEQAKSYINKGFPLDWGLSAAGLLVSVKSKKIINCFDDWYNECVNWTYQDQISLDPCLWRNKINNVWLDINLRHNDYISFLEGHTSDV